MSSKSENFDFLRDCQIYEAKIFLNMNSKLDKESRSCDDIAFPYEILVNLRF